MAMDAARLAVAVAVVAAVAAAGAALSPSVHYVRSDRGNFFMAPGKTIPAADVAQTLPASSICEQRSCLLFIDEHSHTKQARVYSR